MSRQYEQYLRDEWELFMCDPARTQATCDAVAGVRIARVLDVGCGGAQELLPFLARSNVLGIGVDAAPEIGSTRSRFAGRLAMTSRLCFIRAMAEAVPFQSASFDVVVCRLVLPYTTNALALSEIARVLRVGGVLLLKFHHPRYYIDRIGSGLVGMRWRTVVESIQIMGASVLFHLTRWQGRSHRTREVFQTRWLLRTMLDVHGLAIEGHMPDSNPRTPSYVIVKRGP